MNFNIFIIITTFLILYIIYLCYRCINNTRLESFDNKVLAYNDEEGLQKQLDSGFLHNYKLNYDVVFTNIPEIPINIMNQIFNDVTYKNHINNISLKRKLYNFFVNDTPIFKQQIQKTKKIYNRLSVIAIEILKNINAFQNTKYKNLTFFNRKEKFKFKSLEIIHLDNNNIIFNFLIYKPFRQFQYVVKVHLLKESRDIYIKNYLIYKLDIIGSPLEEVVQKESNNYRRKNKIYDQLKDSNLKLKRNSDNSVSIINTTTNIEFRKKLRQIEKAKKDKNKYKCFNPNSDTGFEMIDSANKQQCTRYHWPLKNFGVWDRPCEKNKDCPFYINNKKQRRFGCNNPGMPGEGLCNMPSNNRGKIIKRIGYTHFKYL